MFYAHPDASSNLIRFSIRGVDAPAGRLRVYDRRRQLLATAGVLRKNDGLHGELWLPLARTTTIVSELEAPGLRGPLRTTHRLVPHRKWTLHLINVVAAARLTEELRRLSPIGRAIQTAIYTRSQVTVNPLPSSLDLSQLDHVPFLRMAGQARDVERHVGIPMSTAAFTRNGAELPWTAGLALLGSGVRIMLTERAAGDIFQWRRMPDGARLLVVSIPPGGTPSDLGFTLAREEMTERVEQWLTTSPPFLATAYRFDTAIIVDTVTDETLPLIRASVSDWNARFAYPRIAIGKADDLLQQFDSRGGTAIPVAPPDPDPQPVSDVPSTVQLVAIAESRRGAVARRAEHLVAALAHALESAGSGLDAIAAQVSALVPGTLVFNPSPFSRSDLLRMTDGTERVVTDVPGLGYAYFPDTTDGGHREEREDSRGWTQSAETHVIEGEQSSLTIDQATGAIASWIDRVDGREWVRSGSPGLNALEAARLERVTHLSLPGVASRLVAQRWSPGRGAIKSTVTVYDHLPWVDIENDAEAVGDRAMSYHFPFAMTEPRVMWEIPAGHNERPAPVRRLEHLRWMRVAGPDDAVLFRALDAPHASVALDGSLVSYAPRGLSRYRLMSQSPHSSPDSPWVFGWGTEPLMTARVRGGQAGRLPRFGRLFSIDRVGVAVLGIVPAEGDGDLIIYLQELLGVDRRVSLGAGVLRFGGARSVDYLGRDRGELPRSPDGTVTVPVGPHGVSALLLSGVELNGG